MDFLIFAGNMGVAALIFLAVIIAGALFVLAFGDGSVREKLRTAAWLWPAFLVAGYLLLAFSILVAPSETGSVTDESHTRVEKLVEVAGADDGYSLEAGDGEFSVVVERDDELRTVVVPTLLRSDEIPFLSTEVTCKLSDKRGFVWVERYDCETTLTATVPVVP